MKPRIKNFDIIVLENGLYGFVANNCIFYTKNINSGGYDFLESVKSQIKRIYRVSYIIRKHNQINHSFSNKEIKLVCTNIIKDCARRKREENLVWEKGK